jgi:hypothetical protein
MEANGVPSPLSAHEAAILESVIYSDLFDFPVTLEEIRRWLPRAVSSEEVAALVESGNLVPRLLSFLSPYVVLQGREGLIEVRRRRQQSSAALMRKATYYGGLIAGVPCVRMVAITGSLAVANAEADADIDFLVVTAPGRVWLTRALVMSVVRLAGLRGTTVCPNYILSEAAIELPERDVYTARELLQMVPLAGLPVYEKMLAANSWWREILPNAEPAHPKLEPKQTSWPRRTAESLLQAPPFDLLEAWLQAHKGSELRRQAGNDEAVFNQAMCKGHFQGWRGYTGQAVSERSRELTKLLV